jgi:sugar fermentation stimulation protein A
MRFFGNTEKALFLSRPNRFTVICELKGKRTRAYLPNPGRLGELLLPGVTIFLESSDRPGRKFPLTAVAVMKGEDPVILHTHRANSIVRYLIGKGRIPGLEGAEVAAAEVTRGGSRFDLLLKKGGRDILLEVKSCTLFSAEAAMFPDAVTSRGRRHVEALARLAGGRTSAAVIFLVHAPSARLFMPEYHTDLDFSLALLKARPKVTFLPVGVSWHADLSLKEEVRPLKIPWALVEKEAHDRGSYLVVLKLDRKRILAVGKLGRIRFNKGYYLYVGSAARHLSRRVARHRRLRKKTFWHIDYLRAAARFVTALPVRSAHRLECDIAAAVRAFSGGDIPGFGASDCACPSHLFHRADNPLETAAFNDLIQFFRMDRPAAMAGPSD